MYRLFRSLFESCPILTIVYFFRIFSILLIQTIICSQLPPTFGLQAHKKAHGDYRGTSRDIRRQLIQPYLVAKTKMKKKKNSTICGAWTAPRHVEFREDPEDEVDFQVDLCLTTCLKPTTITAHYSISIGLQFGVAVLDSYLTFWYWLMIVNMTCQPFEGLFIFTRPWNTRNKAFIILKATQYEICLIIRSITPIYN